MTRASKTAKNGGGAEREVARLFANFHLQVEPEAVRLLLSECNGNLNDVVEYLAARHPDALVVSAADVSDFLKRKHARVQNGIPTAALSRVGVASQSFVGTGREKGAFAEERSAVLATASEECGLRATPATPLRASVLKSFGNERPQNDFLPIFRDRYERLSGILRKRLRSIQIRALKNRLMRTKGCGSGDAEEFAVIGIVADIRKTAKGNTIVELEDATGEISVLIPSEEEVVEDEVLGISGRISNSGLLIAERVVRPDVPLHFNNFNTHSNAKTALANSASGCEEVREEEVGVEEKGYVIFISDIHAGSKMFEEECWNAFLEWLREHSASLTAVVVAGDIVDGIGVYPEQEKDLAVKDVEEQYKIVASSLKRLPSSLPVVLSPGNHDAVRNAEPQPPLPANIQRLFPANTIFVSNPAYIRIGNRTILIYHGQSYDDFIGAIPRLRYEKPAEVMEEMLKRRHLAPIYGKNVSLFPISYDYGVIEPVPDILHCGHAHTVGVSQYRRVLLVNSGAWQSQTSYQKKRGIVPMPCCATLVELRSLRAKVLSFS